MNLVTRRSTHWVDARSAGEAALQRERLLLLIARRRDMKYMIINDRTPNGPTFCALCCTAITRSYVREISTRLSYCNTQCYDGHVKVAVLALEHKGRVA
jgi:hypothetical protein